jgi:hypothetical protein
MAHQNSSNRIYDGKGFAYAILLGLSIPLNPSVSPLNMCDAGKNTNFIFMRDQYPTPL